MDDLLFSIKLPNMDRDQAIKHIRSIAREHFYNIYYSPGLPGLYIGQMLFGTKGFEPELLLFGNKNSFTMTLQFSSENLIPYKDDMLWLLKNIKEYITEH